MGIQEEVDTGQKRMSNMRITPLGGVNESVIHFNYVLLSIQDYYIHGGVAEQNRLP